MLLPISRYGLIGMAVATLLFVVLVPATFIVTTSFTSTAPFSDSVQVVWLDHYQDLLVDEGFWRAVSNTLVYALASTVGQVAAGTFFALIIWNTQSPARQLLRVTLFVPYLLVPTVVAVVLWRFLADPNAGLIPLISSAILGRPLHLFGPDLIGATLIALSVWIFAPFSMVLVLARLEQIPNSMLESVRSDGGSRWDVLRWVVWPEVRGTITAVVLFRLVVMATKFDVPYLVLGSGLLGSEKGPVSVLIFEEAYELLRFGRACAIAVLASLVLAVPLFLSARRRRSELA